MFEVYIEKIIKLEGKYSNHKSDSGGKTMYGITEQLARKYNHIGLMKDLPVDRAKQIYKMEFWLPLKLEEIEKTCPSIVEELLDTGINQGVGRAAEYLQLSLNAFNRGQKDYKDIRVDGSIGENTLVALKAYMKKRSGQGEVVLMRALNSLQGAFYIQLSQRREKDEDFVFGWILNRIII